MRLRSASLAALVALLLVLPARARAPFTGRCVGVLDGDSIQVLNGRVTVEIRLEGIDAPEHRQAYGDRAKQGLSELVYGKDVEIVGKTFDDYGRLVARVFVARIDVNLEMVRRGLAWHYQRYSSERALADAEAVARAGHVGLWADPAAVPPWSYRRGPQSSTGAGAPGASTSSSLGSTSTDTTAAAGEVRGNTSSRVFHTASCPNFRCRNCTARFPSEAGAIAAGYRPAGCCHPGHS